MKIILFDPVFRADSEYHISFNENTNSFYQNQSITRQKPIKSGLLISILRMSTACPCFFLDIFIPFCSFSKGLLNEIEFSLDRHRCEYDFSGGIICICTLWVVYLIISSNTYPYPLFYRDFCGLLDRSRCDLSNETKLILD
jgi:hypothetical protein